MAIATGTSPKLLITKKWHLRHLLVEVLLETGENGPELFRSAQVGHGAGDGVAVFELQLRGDASLDPTLPRQP